MTIASSGAAVLALRWADAYPGTAERRRVERAVHMQSDQAKSKCTTHRVKATTHMPTTMVAHSVSEVRGTSRRSCVLIVR